MQERYVVDGVVHRGMAVQARRGNALFSCAWFGSSRPCRQSYAKYGYAGRVMAGEVSLCEPWLCWPMLCLAGIVHPGLDVLGGDRHGKALQAWQGTAGHGKARRGVARQARSGFVLRGRELHCRHGKLLLITVMPGGARHRRRGSISNGSACRSTAGEVRYGQLGYAVWV